MGSDEAKSAIEMAYKNSIVLAAKAVELRDRIDTLNRNGHSADATIDELLKTCVEIGRLNDIVKKGLG